MENKKSWRFVKAYSGNIGIASEYFASICHSMWHFHMPFHLAHPYAIPCGTSICCSMWHFHMPFHVAHPYAIPSGTSICHSVWHFLMPFPECLFQERTKYNDVNFEQNFWKELLSSICCVGRTDTISAGSSHILWLKHSVMFRHTVTHWFSTLISLLGAFRGGLAIGAFGQCPVGWDTVRWARTQSGGLGPSPSLCAFV